MLGIVGIDSIRGNDNFGLVVEIVGKDGSIVGMFGILGNYGIVGCGRVEIFNRLQAKKIGLIFDKVITKHKTKQFLKVVIGRFFIFLLWEQEVEIIVNLDFLKKFVVHCTIY